MIFRFFIPEGICFAAFVAYNNNIPSGIKKAKYTHLKMAM
jgi:hypothetical protein